MPHAPAGHAYLLAFPFELLVADGPGPIKPLEIEGRRVTIYWPFRNRPEPAAAPRSIDLARVPHRPHTEAPHIRAPIPTITPQVNTGIARADSLRIDVFGPNVDTASEFVQGLALRLFGLIRHCTRQWWVKRPNSELERLIRNGFDINHRGELAGGVTAAIGIEPRRGTERTLTQSDFAVLCDELARGGEIPLAWDLFYDALYFVMAAYGGNDIRRAVLDAANACEVGLLSAASRVGERRGLTARQVLRTLASSDLLYNLRMGLPQLVGRSFPAESPDAYNRVHRLWRARGSVSHGRLPGVRLGARPLPTLDEFHEMIGGVEAALNWLDAL